MGKSIVRWDSRVSGQRSRCRLRASSHRLDESAAGYSLAGCTPAEPASASPAGFIFDQGLETVNLHRLKGGGIFVRQNEEISVGIDNAESVLLRGLVRLSLTSASSRRSSSVVNTSVGEASGAVRLIIVIQKCQLRMQKARRAS